ncbi:MAG: hypothetical protein ACPIOQ_54030, partial [Promethearchaeia archaeon]
MKTIHRSNFAGWTPPRGAHTCSLRRHRGERIHAPSITAVISSVCLVLLVSSSGSRSRWAQGRPKAFGAPLRLRATLRLRGGNAQAELQVQQTIA